MSIGFEGAYAYWMWQGKLLGRPRREAVWEVVPWRIQQTYVAAAETARTVLQEALKVVDGVAVSEGSEHYEFGRETMKDDIVKALKGFFEEVTGEHA
jgi:hypothetical protein